MDSENRCYPLLVEFHEVILGHGFAAGLQVQGRVIVEKDDGEEGEWWIYGVNPGAIADRGTTLQEAVGNFRLRFKTALVDYAVESRDFPSFKQAVETFFTTTDPETQTAWETARQAVRAGKLSLSELPRVSESTPPTILVERLELTPSANPLDDNPSSLAA